jgi:hypothetical protein
VLGGRTGTCQPRAVPVGDNHYYCDVPDTGP